MSQPAWFDQTPAWVFWSFVPVLGGGAIAYAGVKSGSNIWIGVGAGFVAGAIVISSIPVLSILAKILWFAQIATAFALKRAYLAKTYPKDLALPDDPKLFAVIAANRPKVDINTCSKNDLVNTLGLPIVYANDIESLRDEGHIFTSIEELHDILEIPNATLKKIEPIIIFSYDYRQESDYSWKRINSMSTDDLIGSGIEPNTAKAIAEERQRRGEFKSIMDIKKRTGVPFSAYRHLT
ncbi:MAG: helix-hairpin-helix domain-containing protein [Pseudanabaena sp.]|jgi:DNA uptake protein ComE-like DNA-binding protein|uniref:helix-hairpin-helix domain-containing protein n=1 Tax=Pseudanabaena mucicola TaxID=71190 RepID=UPI002577DBA2|nr:helix-hairpin-helix domain-containing protein [Pseudanabaena mucicola]MCA6593246.1 helix-hairpin-helix domain-containing protein [Pseudanabaena sp. M38BS1SP1A06MG]MCA6600280.1 helix-hairpin-helix domain-containing protein [Pseudanabaena sp. M57BS1SP1A06MG]